MPRLRLLVPLTVPVALVLGASPVLAYTAVSPVLVSDASPWAACLDGQSPGDGSTNYAGAEVEPFVAVDPTDSSHIIGVFQQDRWNDGGAHGLRAASSFDGGQTWPTKSFASFSTCSGSTNTDYVRASDPWVTFDTDGNAYQISLSFSATQVISAVLVSKLPKGGTMWSNPTTLIRDVVGFHFNDKESITGDPARPGYVYAVWDRGTFPSDSRNFRSFFGSHAFRGQPMFSRTTDGGQTWSPAVGMANQNIFTIGNQIAVLPDGTLVDIFQNFQGSGVQPSPNHATEAVMMSRDAGLTWSQPIDISNWTPELTVDPDTGSPIRTGNGLPDLAVDPRNGTIYATWEDGGFSPDHHADVALSKSTDGGHKWSTPVKVNSSPAGVQAFTPQVAVASDGTVAITYYDFRNNTTDQTTLPTDLWFISSANGGGSWTEKHVDGPFDIDTAPNSRGPFLGDYEGLAVTGATLQDFLAFYVRSYNTPADPLNRSDVFSVRINH